MKQTRPIDSLETILRLEAPPGARYSVRLADFFGAALAGDLLARMIRGTARGIPTDRHLHALHAVFIEAVPPSVLLDVLVEATPDEGSLSRRCIRVTRDGRPLAVATASWGRRAAEAVEYQDHPMDEHLPDPDTLPTTLEGARAEGWPEQYARGPIEFRRVGDRWPAVPASPGATHIEWIRPRCAVPDDPRLHEAAMVMASEFYSHWPFEWRLGAQFRSDRFRLLDHALWIHHPVAWTDWWLLRTTSFVATAGRALATREIFTRDRRLILTAMHEAQLADGGRNS
jgi:acyl-CoA thioesterase-2